MNCWAPQVRFSRIVDVFSRVACWKSSACHRLSPVGYETKRSLLWSASPDSADPVRLPRVQYALPQQVQLRSPVHLSLDQLEPIHLTLQLGIAPMGRQCRLHRFVV